MNDTVAPRATRREWIGLAVIALPCLLYSMDLTVLNLAVPSLSADLKPSSSQLLWIVDIYGFLVAGSLITMGTMAGGLALAAVGFGVVTQIDGASGLAVLVTGFVVFSLGLAPVFTLATDLIVGTAPPERAGAAAAISETGSELGGALGIAILGSIGTAVYRGTMDDAVPAGVPPEAAEAARGTLGAAVAVAERLPDQLGAGLLDAAREAFTRGMRLGTLISAVVAAALAIMAGILLRDVRGGSEPEAQSSVGEASDQFADGLKGERNVG